MRTSSGRPTQGATKAELVEFLNVAMTMQGCPGEEWALKALSAYNALGEGSAAPARSAEPEGLVAGTVAQSAEGCCPIPEDPPAAE